MRYAGTGWRWPRPYRSKEEAFAYALGKIGLTPDDFLLIRDGLDQLARKRARQYAETLPPHQREWSVGVGRIENLLGRIDAVRDALREARDSFEIHPTNAECELLHWGDLVGDERKKALAEANAAFDNCPAKAPADGGAK